MKYGISLSTYPSQFGPITFKAGTLDEKLSMAKASGFTGLDLFSHKLTDREIQDLKKQLFDNSLSVYMFIPFYFAELQSSFTDLDITKRENFISEYSSQIDTAEYLGAHRMPIGFIRGWLAETDSLKAYKERLAESLSIVSAYAKSHGITLCIEPINSNEINTFYHACEAYDFINEYGLDDVDLLLDSFHINYENRSQTEIIEACADRIGHYHISDSDRLPVGKGTIDFEPILNKLKEIGYDGCMSVEGLPGQDPLQSAKESYLYLTSLRKE